MKSRSQIRRSAPSILIVDDEPLLLLGLSEFLQQSGFNFLEAANADEAIVVLQHNDSGIDVVFTDIRMPGSMDGVGLAKWIRRNRPGLPVLLTSGNAMNSDVARDLCEDGPFSEKPYDFDVVLQRVQQAIAKRQVKNASRSGSLDVHARFACPTCGQSGEVVRSGVGEQCEIIRLSNGFHIEEDRLHGQRDIIICDRCNEIDPAQLSCA